MSKAATVQPQLQGWLLSRPFDLALILGITLIAALVAIIAGADPVYLEALVLVDLWLLGYHHVIATFTKLAGTASDRRQNFALIWLLFPAALITTVTVGLLYGVIAIVTVYFFWQWFHYVRQSWGIAQRYRHLAGTMPWDKPRLAELTLWSVPIWGVLNRCHQGSTTFLWMPVWLPPVPLIAVQLAAATSLLLVGGWIYTRWMAWQRGELPLGHTLYMSTHFVVFACAYVFIKDITLGWLMVNIWHNAQYLVFVWIHNRQRFSRDPGASKTLISWLSQPGVMRAISYFGFCLILSTAAYQLINEGSIMLDDRIERLGVETQALAFALLFSMAVNFHHYIVDSIIWKRKRHGAR